MSRSCDYREVDRTMALARVKPTALFPDDLASALTLIGEPA
jgi:hypothetical protein